MMENVPEGILRAKRQQIKNNELDNITLRKLFEGESRMFDVQNLLREGILSQEKHDELYPPPSTEDQREDLINSIKNYEFSDEQIKELVEEGWFTAEYLLNRNAINQSQYNILFATAVKVNFDEWKNIPPLKEGRIDVFIFGIAGSGKSCFLAGLFYHGNSIGRLNVDIDNVTGVKYADTLIEAMEEGRVPTATAVDYIQYIACDIRDDDEHTHPLTFIEMSGEHFQDAYGKTLPDLKKEKPKLVEYLFENPNRKVIFLAIDYQPDRGGETGQRKNFEFMLKFLDKNGVLENVETIVLVITKLDGDDDSLQDDAKRFLENRYKSLTNLCNDYVEKHGLDFYVYKFSLGNFKSIGNFKSKYVFDYNPTDSEIIFDMLCDTTSVLKQKKKVKKTPWSFGNLFKG